MRTGSLACTITGLKDETGRWFRIHICGLAQENFIVEKDDLFLKVEFFKDAGTNPLDFIKKSIYPQVELERKSLADPGTNRNLGSAAWRSYSMDFRTPFPEVDTLRVSVGFGNGAGKRSGPSSGSRRLKSLPFPIPAITRPAKTGNRKNPPALKSSGETRWPLVLRLAGGSEEVAEPFDHTNVDQLFYLSDRLEPVFVGNTSAWLRRGYLDHAGKTVQTDQILPDSVVISFTEKHLVMKSKNLPNHPIAVFPDRTRYIDGNPNVIQEQRDTWYIPLEPKPNPTGR